MEASRLKLRNFHRCQRKKPSARHPPRLGRVGSNCSPERVCCLVDPHSAGGGGATGAAPGHAATAPPIRVDEPMHPGLEGAMHPSHHAGPTSAQRLFSLKFIPSRTVTEQQQHHSDSAAQKAKPHGSEAECLSTAVAVAVRCGAAGWSCFSRRNAQPTALRPLHCAIMPAPFCTHSAPDLPHSYAQKHVLICASPEPSFAPSQSRFAVIANGFLLPRFILTLTLIPPFPATAPCPLVAVSRGLSFLLTLHPPPPLPCSPLTVRVL